MAIPFEEYFPAYVSLSSFFEFSCSVKTDIASTSRVTFVQAMRNVHILEHRKTTFHESAASGLTLSACTYDTSSNDLICAFGPTLSSPVIELRRLHRHARSGQDDISTITSWDAPSPLPDLPCDRILSLHFSPSKLTAYLVLAGGDLVIVRETPHDGQERIEIVGSIDAGILAACWSWQGDSLAVLTREGAFIVMSEALEPLSETTLSLDDLSMSRHVSVGWGKKETQFHGKRAKALRDPTMPEFVEEGKSSPCEDDSSMISWRGDGQFIAVTSRLASPRRVIRVYSAAGSLDSVSEPQDGLEGALTWRPHGNVIATIKRHSQKAEVVFFERNGLRHGEFDLRLSVEQLSCEPHIRLAFNMDSSILAVVLAGRVQFWMSKNYHWYLKQEISAESTELILQWHDRDPMRCAVHSSTFVKSLVLGFRVDRGSTVPPHDYGLVAVIDGCILKLTPFKHAGVPPPMSYLELSVGENIQACSFSGDGTRLALITTKSIYHADWDMCSAQHQTAELRHTTNIQVRKVADLPSDITFTTVLFINNKTIYVHSPAVNVTNADETARLFACEVSPVDGDNRALERISCPSSSEALITDARATVLLTGSSTGLEVLYGVSEPLPPVPDVLRAEVALISKPAHEHESVLMQHCVVTLKEDGHLFINEKLAAADTTSFILTQDHLFYTTASHQLKTFLLPKDLENIGSLDAGVLDDDDERVRSIERGAQLVTVVPSSSAVILQMPRGNLETIYPRVLLLSAVSEDVGRLKYRSAFLVCQKHQIDLNILYDLDPHTWLANVGIFIDQLRKPSRIDEFISKLKEEDVTRTIYRNVTVAALTDGKSSHPSAAKGGVIGKAKITLVCQALIAHLETRRPQTPATIQNIITAHICSRPPNTTAALGLVSKLQSISSEEADLAVSHLLFLLPDTSRVFNAALSMYDLQLALLVAQNSQRDPKEYLTFLRQLQSLPEQRRRFVIDDHLREYSKALQSLHALGVDDEIESYTIKHSLYKESLRLYRAPPTPSPSRAITISRLFAEYLTRQSQRFQAAVLYESISDFESAYPLYALAHRWQEALACASLAMIGSERIQDLARQLAVTMRSENRDYRAAARIYVDYLSDPLEAASVLCRGCYFAEAICLLCDLRYDNTMMQEIPRLIDDSLREKAGEIIELTSDMQTQLKSQVPRIEELRIKKAEDPLAFFGGDAVGPVDDEILDNISLAPTDASTMAGRSMFTRYGGGGPGGGTSASTKFGGTIRSDASRRTSKTRRKEERKRAQGKKGSVYEEEYLVASVGRLINRLNDTYEEVQRLVLGLQRRGLIELSEMVESVMISLESLCLDARGRVWPVGSMTGEGASPNGIDGIPFESSQGAEEVAVVVKRPEVRSWRGIL